MADVEAVMARPAKPKLLPDVVVHNVVALYGVQISRKVVPLASIPYLARVLGPNGWGEVAFVTSLADLIVIFIEFGFTLSATRSIARHRDDPFERGRIATGVLCAQAMLAAAAVAIALLAAPFIPLFHHHPSLLTAGLVYAVAQGFVPLWYFQGMERIHLVASCEVGGKLSALAGLFIFVKGPQDVWRAVALQALSPAACALLGITLTFRTSSLCRPQRRLVNAVLKEGWDMFMFRSAESLYGVANAFLLGLFAAPSIVGYFASADKITRATAGLVNPVRESLYPRINHLMHRDRAEGVRIARLGAGFMVGAGFVLSLTLFVLANQIIALLLGGNFEPAVHVLRILSPLPMLLAITFSSGQLWLFPLRKDREVFRVVFRVALLNLCLSFLLGSRWGHIGMASAVLVCESVVASSLLWKVLRTNRGGEAQACTLPPVECHEG